MPKVQDIAENVARHARGVLSQLQPDLGVACRAAGVLDADLDLLSEERSSPVFMINGALRRASADLRRWFEENAASHGVEARLFTEAIVTFSVLPNRDESHACRVRCRLRTHSEQDFEAAIPEGPTEDSRLRPPQLNEARVPDEASVAELARLANVGGGVRWAAFTALGHSADPRAIDELLGLSRSTDWTVRRAAVEGIGLRPRSPAVADRLAVMLDDDDQRVVRAAIEAIARLGHVRLHDRVVALTATNEESTREVAVAALEQLWEAGDVDRLVAIARTDVSKEVRCTAARVLRNHVDSNSWHQLFDLWIDDPRAEHRTWACQLVEIFGGQAMENRLASARHDRDGHVRKAAERAVARLRRSSCGPASE